MEAPTYQAPPPPAEDPELKALNETAKQQDLAATSSNAAVDTAQLMMTYGTRGMLAVTNPSSTVTNIGPEIYSSNPASLASTFTKALG